MKNKYDEFKDISLSNLSVYFSTPAQTALKKFNVNTLQDLFTIYDNEKYIEYFGTYKMYDEITNTIRLLRCKFLNETPIISIDDEPVEYEDILNLLGFSAMDKKAFGLGDGYASYKKMAYDIFKNVKSTKDFFDTLLQNADDIKYGLNHSSGIGPKTIEEIEAKVNIILEKYNMPKINLIDKPKKKGTSEKNIRADSQNSKLISSKQDEIDDLNELLNELNTLQEETKRVNERVNILIEKVKSQRAILDIEKDKFSKVK